MDPDRLLLDDGMPRPLTPEFEFWRQGVKTQHAIGGLKKLNPFDTGADKLSLRLRPNS